MKVLLLGYTGYCVVDDMNILLTSYSLSLNENIIKSEGAGRILVNDVTDESGNSFRGFKRFGLNAVRDYPGYELSISFDAQIDIFKKMMARICRSDMTGFIPVKFYDDATGIFYEFEDACFTSCQVNVDNNSAATMTLTFVIFRDTLEISYGDYDYQKKRNGPEELVGNKLMPYWAWDAEYDDFEDRDLHHFSFSIQRPVTPKFGCEGKISDDNAPPPIKIIMGVPTATYELTYVMTTATQTDDYATIHSNEVATRKAHRLLIRYGRPRREVVSFEPLDGLDSEYDRVELLFTNCYVDSYSPELANPGGPNMMNLSGTVYGRVELKDVF